MRVCRHASAAQLRRTTLLRTPVNSRAARRAGTARTRPSEHLVVPVYPLAVARDHVRSVSKNLIVPAPAGDDVFARRIVEGDEAVVPGTAREGVYGPPVGLAVTELVVATPATDVICSSGPPQYVVAGAASDHVARRRPFLHPTYGVATGPAAQHGVVAGTTVEGVRAVAAEQAVASAQPEECIWSSPTDQPVVGVGSP